MKLFNKMRHAFINLGGQNRADELNFIYMKIK